MNITSINNLHQKTETNGPDFAKATTGKQRQTTRKASIMNTTKTAIFTIAIFAALTMGGVQAANAAVLLGGYDGNNANGAPIQDASAVGNFSFTVTPLTAVTIGFNPGAFQQGSSILWGTTDLDPDASTANNNSVLLIDTNPATVQFDISNTGPFDIELSKLHWITKRDTNDSPTDVTITYTAGDLSDSIGTNSGLFSLAGLGQQGHDFDLTGMLTDTMLAAGESATFTWFTSGGDNTQNDRLRLDNLAFSGTVVIPEPSTIILAGLGLAGLCLRRRRR